VKLEDLRSKLPFWFGPCFASANLHVGHVLTSSLSILYVFCILIQHEISVVTVWFWWWAIPFFPLSILQTKVWDAWGPGVVGCSYARVSY